MHYSSIDKNNKIAELTDSNVFKLFDNVTEDIYLTDTPTVQEMKDLFGLRAEVFCRELAWVGTPDDKTEIDDFDYTCTHIGGFVNDNAVGYLRVHPHKTSWMLNTIFADALLDSIPAPQSNNSCEVSRLLIKNEFRGGKRVEDKTILTHLLSELYIHCKSNKIRYVYMVVTPVTLAVLARHGLKATPLGDTKVMTDGCKALAAVLDWESVTRIGPMRRKIRSVHNEF
ncbi:MAG: GNAT family N-acetyltransferase [Aliivibrio sp.]|uniref:acyl-homoserine-lactone synthase n=1 Tax=Aliivibrio sp. TaxID=1872443 RepID=UPI001A46D060|nr:GNAT family N-acetyltransferase [Aliivibrio sp.]